MDSDLDLVPLFQPDLLRDEKVFWAGQPRPGLHLSATDGFLIPFSLLWGGFALFWEAGVLGILEGHPAPSLFALWGIPFVLIGQYIIWGRFIYKVYRNRRTFYAVTNQRVLMLITIRTRRLQSVFLNQLPTVNKTVRRDGSGNLEFGVTPFGMAMYANSGTELFGGRAGALVPAFYDIREVEAVYQLVMRLRADLQQSA